MTALDPPVASLILVVDDDARSVRPLARMLREDGFEVEIATDGAAAIERLSRAPLPDVLLTDIRMPRLDGIAVARFARTRRPRLPIFVITCYPQEAWALEGTMDPRPRVIPKPLDYEVLREALRESVPEHPAAPSTEAS